MQDMTMSEVLRDPLIRQMLRADGTSLTAFARLLDRAARKQAILRATNDDPSIWGNAPYSPARDIGAAGN